jgi:hypothetical protein
MGTRNASAVRLIRKNKELRVVEKRPQLDPLVAIFADAEVYGFHQGPSTEWPRLALTREQEQLLQVAAIAIKHRTLLLDASAEYASLTYGGRLPFNPGKVLYGTNLNWVGDDPLFQLVTYLDNGDPATRDIQQEIEVCLNEQPDGHFSLRISQDGLNPAAVREFTRLMRILLRDSQNLAVRPGHV